MNRVELKEKAKKSLQGKYGEAIKLFLVFFLISLASSMVIAFLEFWGINENISSLLADIISLVISGLLYFGYYNFFLKISRNEEVTWNELFARTDLFLPYIAISLLVSSICV